MHFFQASIIKDMQAGRRASRAPAGLSEQSRAGPLKSQSKLGGQPGPFGALYLGVRDGIIVCNG